MGKALSGELTCMVKGLVFCHFNSTYIAWKVDNERMRAIELFIATRGYELRFSEPALK